MAEIKFKPAKVTIEKDKFLLTVGAAKKVIPVGEINDAASVRKLVGKSGVEAAVSGKTIVAVGRRVPKCYWITCYFVGPDVFKQILPDIRNQLVKKYVDNKVIDKKFADILKKSF